jgi:class 3 adenylate cyclase
VVYKYEGTIDKFTGDGLVALFGAPVAHENDPERAIRAALEMQAILEPWRLHTRQAYGFDFEIRGGINTGPVIAGKVGNDLHMEYTVIGETVKANPEN